MLRSRIWSPLLVLLLLPMLLGACGDDDDGSAESTGDQEESTGDQEDVSEPGVIKIGTVFELTGASADAGDVGLKTVQLAVEQINEAGGITISGRPYTFEIVSTDARSEPAATVAAVRQLIEDDEVQFIIGPYFTPLALQAAEITRSAPVLHLSPAGAWEGEGYLGPDSRLFQTSLSATTIAPTMAEAVKQEFPEVTRVAALNQDDDLSASLVGPVYLQALKDAGVEVVEDLRYPQGTTDFTSYASRIASLNVDAVYYQQLQSLAPTAFRALHEQNAAPRFIGTNLSPQIVLEDALGGDPLPEPALLVQLTVPVAEGVSPQMDDFIAAWKDKYGDDLPALINFAPWIYDFVFMLTEAIEAAGTSDEPDQIADALRELQYDGINGTICWHRESWTPVHDVGYILVSDGQVENRVISAPASC